MLYTWMHVIVLLDVHHITVFATWSWTTIYCAVPAFGESPRTTACENLFKI